MHSAVVVFPGSNCVRDLAVAIRQASGQEPALVWHTEAALPARCDLVGLPGGFSFGDYLRSGAIATRSPIMNAVRKFAKAGGYILGICNGFQILAESRLLPGAFLRNDSLRFVCRDTWLRVSTCNTPYTALYAPGRLLRIPVAHADGAYTLADDERQALIEDDRVAFRYAPSDASRQRDHNPNGSVDDIAGVLSRNRRVLGMMPHPERAVDDAHGGCDGAHLFRSVVQSLA